MTKRIIDQIRQIEEEIRKTPYHKGTEHHIGRLKARISQLKKELSEKASADTGGGGNQYAVPKQGDATAVLVGPPSVGKSTLLNQLTGARSKIGNYDFTTLDVIPGMFTYLGAKIQLLDVPGLIVGAAVGKGNGKQILSVVRNSDLIILITDVNQIDWLKKARDELYQAGIRLDAEKPKITIKKKKRGGINVINPFQNISSETVSAVAEKFGLENAEIIIEEEINTIDRLIDGFAKDRVFLPAISVINKVDIKKVEVDNCLLISSETGINLDKLKKLIWQKLNLIRVYLKSAKDKEPDKENPLILKKGSTVKQALQAISTDLVEEVDQVLIWGEKVKYPGQIVSLSQTLFDEAVLYFKK